jgi:hypothetical protein
MECANRKKGKRWPVDLVNSVLLEAAVGRDAVGGLSSACLITVVTLCGVLPVATVRQPKDGDSDASLIADLYPNSAL